MEHQGQSRPARRAASPPRTRAHPTPANSAKSCTSQAPSNANLAPDPRLQRVPFVRFALPPRHHYQQRAPPPLLPHPSQSAQRSKTQHCLCPAWWREGEDGLASRTGGGATDGRAGVEGAWREGYARWGWSGLVRFELGSLYSVRSTSWKLTRSLQPQRLHDQRLSTRRSPRPSLPPHRSLPEFRTRPPLKSTPYSTTTSPTSLETKPTARAERVDLERTRSRNEPARRERGRHVGRLAMADRERWYVLLSLVSSLSFDPSQGNPATADPRAARARQ